MRIIARVFEILDIAVAVLTHHQIKIPVVVEVGESGDANSLDINTIEGICCAGSFCEIRIRSVARVFKIVDISIVFTHHNIKIPVVVEVGEGGCANCPNINTIEGICRASSLCKRFQVPPATFRRV